MFFTCRFLQDKTKKRQIFLPLFLARLKGFEPLTLWFVAKYSIQLSYKRVFCFAAVSRLPIYNTTPFSKSQAFFLIFSNILSDIFFLRILTFLWKKICLYVII